MGQKDIKIWGMPSHWTQNHKLYAAYSVTIVFTTLLSYYHWPRIAEIGSSSFHILKNLFLEHFYDPMYGIYVEVMDTRQKEEYQNAYAIEKGALSDMIASFEIKHLHQSNRKEVEQRSKALNMELIMDKYKNDIESPITSATKGSLLQNIFVQIQSMKVATSKLLIDVDDLLDSNRINLEIMATIPFVGLLYFCHQIWSSSKGKNKRKTESINELRFLFRSIYSILIRNFNEQYVGYEDCGLILFLMHKCQLWAQQSFKDKFISKQEFEWMKFDINHFISREFTVQQRLPLLAR